MKQLIVSLKSSNEVLSEFKKAYSKAKKRPVKHSHYEISFDNRKEFQRFLNNIPLLSAILIYKPKSVYELAKLTGVDVSNLNKTMRFLESMNVLELKSSTASGRLLQKPVVDYESIQFQLAA